MQLVSGWVEPDSGCLVSVDNVVLKLVESFRQTSQSQNEAGGLLLGLRRGRHIEIKWLTVPQETDTRKPYSFIRGKQGHEIAAMDIWRITASKADYVGEWHTHPETHPNPSGIDVSEWLRLSSARDDGRPLIFMIVGTDGFYACLCRDQTIAAMTPIEFD